MDVEYFIQRWTAREGGAERANYQMFLSELCDVLGVPRPDPAGTDTAHNDYVFERAVRPRESDGGTAPKRIDLYKKGAFILEAKQSRLPGAKNAIPTQQPLPLPAEPEALGRRHRGAAWDVMMQNARKQAEGYVFLLDADQPAPPFIIICDVGHSLEVFADFSGTGRAYSQFPDRNGFRIFMDDLRDENTRKRLACIWTDPHALDPTRTSARVTRNIAKRLADVSKSLEAKGCNAEDVAHFLMRCLFTMFAEDTDLLPKESFSTLLEKSVADPGHFPHRLKSLWQQMEKGEDFSHVIEARVRHFNGGLFKDTTVFELNREEIGELLAAAKADWRQVDPAIFGTLLEQALDKTERRKLGAHYTPRSYVQRLVDVTVMEPLRADWQAALTKAQQARDEGDDKQAIALVLAFHHKLCTTRVLDPACGTGNFLYVALEMMKQLEGEVLQTLTDLGEAQARLALAGETVDPHQFLGLELNPRAAAIAELVIWIGYLQWHYRNHESHPAEPILRAFSNINFGHREGYDAVLTWDGYPVPAVVEKNGKRVEAYPTPRRPVWPEAEFIVGNPPFVGSKRLGKYLTHQYIDALRQVETSVPASVDYVMYWWNRAAQLVSTGRVRRAGLVSTNTITQYYNSRALRSYLDGKKAVSLVWAIPDHPWVDVEDGARVRVSLGCLERGRHEGTAAYVVREDWADESEASVGLQFHSGRVNSQFRTGSSIYDCVTLKANSGLCWQGVKLVGDGFRVTSGERDHLSGSMREFDRYLRPYLTGMAVNRTKQPEWVIDFYGLTDTEARKRAPTLYEHLLEKVKGERLKNRDQGFREKWWLFGRPRPELRAAVDGLKSYLVTSEVSKHRFFTTITDPNSLIDGSLVAIAVESLWIAAILSSRAHLAWTLWAAGTLEDRPRYQNQLSFDRFPFPQPTGALRSRLGELYTEIENTRREVRSDYPDLELTGIYNLIEKVKAGTELSSAEEDAKQRGRVLILKELHDRIDALVAEAYGWPADLPDEQILERLVALNAERAKEEAAGHVRWLRPDYQIPRFGKGAVAKSGELDLGEAVAAIDKGLPAFPTDRYEQPLAIEAVLAASGRAMDVGELSRGFKRGGKRIEQRVRQVLDTLVRYGRVTALPDGRFAARPAS